MAIPENQERKKITNPWFWIPSLYLAEGIPYVVVMTVSVIMYKRLGISNTHIALYTSWLYLPWVIKPLWGPLVDLLRTKRWWIITMQLFIGAGLSGVALTIPVSDFFKFTLIFFWLLAFSSATHDIAVDGFYMIGLNQKEQTFFVGIRSTFYRIAMLVGQGLIVIIAGYFESKTGNIKTAWSVVFFIMSALFILFSFYHRFLVPKVDTDLPSADLRSKNYIKDFFIVFSEYFKKKNIWVILIFLLVYRLGESQLVKLAAPFLLDSRDTGGLGLSTGDIGFIYGTLGIISLTAGGILGGFLASRNGLKYWFWWMVAAINLPHLTYVYLSFALPHSYSLIGLAVAIEQFGYGFGFTAYMLYMIYISQGKYKTAHFAISTGFMALGMMIPGMFSGWLQEIIGYQNFFVWVMICAVPCIATSAFIKIDPSFGIKKET